MVAEFNERQIDVFPGKSAFMKERESCWPEGIISSPTKVEVPLPNLIEHSVIRIINERQEVIDMLFNRDLEQEILELTFTISYGYDGSTDHSRYHIRNESNVQDGSIIYGSMNCLQLETRNGDVFFLNLTPG